MQGWNYAWRIKIYNFRYADDTNLLANTQDELLAILHTLETDGEWFSGGANMVSEGWWSKKVDALVSVKSPVNSLDSKN